MSRKVSQLVFFLLALRGMTSIDTPTLPEPGVIAFIVSGISSVVLAIVVATVCLDVVRWYRRILSSRPPRPSLSFRAGRTIARLLKTQRT